MNINNFISFITSLELQRTILPLKFGFLAISLFFLGTIIFVLFRTDWMKYVLLERLVEFLTYRPYGMKKISKEWAKILARLKKASESEYKLAVIEADEMFDNTLKKMEYKGRTFEERTERLVTLVSNVEQIREAHKIRNNIVYDPNYKLGLDEAKRALEVYEQAFRELEIF